MGERGAPKRFPVHTEDTAHPAHAHDLHLHHCSPVFGCTLCLSSPSARRPHQVAMARHSCPKEGLQEERYLESPESPGLLLGTHCSRHRVGQAMPVPASPTAEGS